MEAPEVPTEHLHEHIQEHAQSHGPKFKWVMGVALSSALLAVMAALASLMAGHHVNEAMIDQIRSSDQWNYYQAKGIKAAVLSSKLELLNSLEKTPSAADHDKVAKYEKDQEKIKEVADEKEKSSEHHLQTHVVFAKAVTLFQVAIAIGAISVLAHKRQFWFVSIVVGVAGLFFLIKGFMMT
jgi:Domain of unknown function (DUF4337)